MKEAFGSCQIITTMTPKVEDIDDKVNRLEKRIAELEKRDNFCVLLNKHQEDEESLLSIVKSLCKGFGILGLIAFTAIHLVFFFISSYKILDFNIEKYFIFLAESICKFYQLFGYCGWEL